MTESTPNGRIAVVTGASGGIGSVIAAALAEAGFHVVAHYSTRAGRAEELRTRILESGGACTTVRADLESADAATTIMAAVDELVDRGEATALGALVNNAGLLLGPSLADAGAADFDRYFAVNTRAPLLLIQAAATRMTRGASVVNISSAAVRFPSAGDIVYAMSKAAVEALTYHSASALAPAGIRVNTVVPGFTDNGHPGFRNELVRAHLESFAPLGGVASPQDVADAVAFLVSDKASRITATTLDVSGGSTVIPRGGTGLSLRALAAEHTHRR